MKCVTGEDGYDILAWRTISSCLLKALDELLLSISDHLLQPLDVICTAIHHILHVSK
jgi:hypothetical protein